MDLKNLKLVLGNSQTRSAMVLFFLITLAVTQMEAVFGLFLKAKYHYYAQQAGMLLAMIGVLMVSVQGGLIGKLVKKYGEAKLILVGTVFCGFGLFGFARTDTMGWVIFFLSVLGLGHGILHPSLSSLASKGADPVKKGVTMGTFQSFGSLARVVGPPIAGFLYDQMSFTAPFYGGTIILMIALVLCVVVLKPLKPVSS